jgi:hypothetical protein
MTYEEAYNITKEFAQNLTPPKDKISFLFERDGCFFFHVDFKVRPRYIGFGIVLKIFPTGKTVKISNPFIVLPFLKYLKE